MRTPCRRLELQVGVDVPLRVDHSGDAGPGVADQVGRAAEVLVDDLPEEHLSTGRLASIMEGIPFAQGSGTPLTPAREGVG